MAVVETWLETDLKKPIKVQRLETNLFKGDKKANRIGVVVLDNGAAASLTNCTIQGVLVRDDDATITFAGNLSGNRASVLLPQSAYAKEGPINIVIRAVEGSGNNITAKTVLGAVSGYVVRSESGAIVDDSQISNNEVPSITQLLALMGDMQTSKTACDTATAKITNMTVSNTTLAAGSNATAAISTVSGHYNIAFGIPRGDKGDPGDVSTAQLGTDTYTLTAGTAITSGDLNDYTSTGNYRVASASVAETITNTPVTTSGYMLKVMLGADGTSVIQMAVSEGGSQMYLRRKNGSTWEAWKTYSSGPSLTGRGGYTGGDLNDLKTPGIYWIASDTVNQNWPSNITWTSETRQFAMVEVVKSQESSSVIIQRMTSYLSGTIYVRYFNNNTWYDWQRCAPEAAASGAYTGSLNDLKVNGLYWCNTSQTTTGWPVTGSGNYGMLEVKAAGGAVMQRLTLYQNDNAPRLFERIFNVSWRGWGEYQRVT